MPQSLTPQTLAGYAIYSQLVLSIYDWYVLGLSNRFAWRCPSSILLEHYDAHISNNHLDMGVGTGYFLDRCRFSSQSPHIALMDMNPNCLQMTQKRLQRYAPKIYQHDVLSPIANDIGPFQSIGLNYVLHCLPGTLGDKTVVFANAQKLLAKGGIFFGSTILADAQHSNRYAAKLMSVYNSKGIFSNLSDTRPELERTLKRFFSDVSIKQHGAVALFRARSIAP